MSIIQEINTVVTPVDFSDNSRLIAQSSAYLAAKFSASVHLLFIVQNFEEYSGFFVPNLSIPGFEGDLLESAEKKMASFCGELQGHGRDLGTALYHKVLLGDVGEKIVEYAEEIGADLIVMGTHGYKGLEKIMFGSVADKVVRAASCPVMTINPYTCC